MNHSNNNTTNGKKYKDVNIYDQSRQSSPDKWHKVPQSIRMTLLTNPKRIAEKNKIYPISSKMNTM